MKIAISTTSFADFNQEPLKLLNAANLNIVKNTLGRKLEEHEVINLLQGCVGIIAGTEPLTAKVMDAIPTLRVISRCGIGLDSVDLDAAKKRGITVCTTPDAPSQAVAELTLALCLAMLRNIPLGHMDICSGHWQKRGGNLLQGKKLGIIGLGRIGKKVAKIFSALDVEIAYYDPHIETKTMFRSMNFEQLLTWAQIITLHCPLPSDKKAIIGSKELQAINAGAWIVNTARGGLIDESSLYNALKQNHLSGAALDVFEVEPYKGALTELNNIILSPHQASYAIESRVDMEKEAALNLLKSLEITCQLPV